MKVWPLASIWIGLALIAALLSAWLRIATALSEIMVGTLAQLLIAGALGLGLSANEPWIKFLAGAGTIILTFLAGAELDPDVFKLKWKEATVIGLVAFLHHSSGALQLPIICFTGQLRQAGLLVLPFQPPLLQWYMQ